MRRAAATLALPCAQHYRAPDARAFLWAEQRVVMEMEKPFRPAPLDLLARWLFQQLDEQPTVLGIPKANFEVPSASMAIERLGAKIAAPLGVAAGPHTQLAQNIVASWLCGARFIELKTVQILDEIHVSRPCIDSADETYNCEWSQELKLEQSFTEYLNAWVLIHALAHKLGLREPGTFFAMSVGYDLKGIQSERVQSFIRQMRDARQALPAAIDAVAKVYPAVKDLDIPAQLSNAITLSTMHGCPPAEIERIARYLLTELGVHTWVKLNPTLLGPSRLRGILNQKMGFDIEVPDAAFEHDPTFDAAMKMVKSLAATAKGLPQTFGVKLSNTLEVVNRRPVFPANEKMMYLSGRALHPLTLSLADLVNDALDGQVPLSFCGGADALNFAELVADGLGPVTVCTDLLKPGGYARLQQYLVNLERAMVAKSAHSIDAFISTSGGGAPDAARANLKAHLARVMGEERFEARERPLEMKGSRPLGHFDCVAAPCQDACPAHQNIPDYLWLVANGQTDRARDVILKTNAMPAVTGSVCDHPCTERCVRNFYDAPLAIREIKRFAIENALPRPELAGTAKDVSVAIVGAGPAGLSAAYYLAQAGFEVTLIEARKDLGGMVSGVIPTYRLTQKTLGSDLDRLKELGVELLLGRRVGQDVQLTDLRRDFRYVFLAVGAAAGKKLGIQGEKTPGVFDALDFLDQVRQGKEVALGKRVLVIGAGNSAMDASRTARRLIKDGTVDIVYRRTRAQMPADVEEVKACLDEGIGLKDLLAPLRVEAKDGRVSALICQPMKLGERDASGRARPVPVEGKEVRLECDSVIPAISQEPVLDFLANLEVHRNKDGTLIVDEKTGETSLSGLFAGGDLVRGAASVIKAIADGRRVAEEIARRHGATLPSEEALDKGVRGEALLVKKSRLSAAKTVPTLPVEQRGGFEEVLGSFGAETAASEASRCLDCDEMCSLCVTVCPNRANQAYALAPLSMELPVFEVRQGKLVELRRSPFAVAQAVQILNVGDFCNECGNCTTFCPTSGRPYHDKPRFWLDKAGFEEAKGDAWRLERNGAELMIEARLGGWRHQLVRQGNAAQYRGPQLSARLAADPWRVVEVEPSAAITEGTQIDLTACATLIALLASAPVLP